MARKSTNSEIKSYMEVVGHVPESQPAFSDCVEELDREKIHINFLNVEHLIDGLVLKNHVKKLNNMFLNKKIWRYRQKNNSSNGNNRNSDNNNIFKNLLDCSKTSGKSNHFQTSQFK